MSDIDLSDLSNLTKAFYRQFKSNFEDKMGLEPWTEQKVAMKQVAQAINNEKDVIVINAPMGAGKSLMNTAFIEATKDNYSTLYCTPQKKLMAQIEEDEYINDNYIGVRGRSNYICDVAKNNDKIRLHSKGGNKKVKLQEGDISADKSPSRRFANFPHNGTDDYDGYGPCCDYQRLLKGEGNKERACSFAKTMYRVNKVLDGEKKGNVLTNFSFFLSSPIFRQHPITDNDRKLDVLVIDEADQLESRALDAASFKIGPSMTGRLNIEIPTNFSDRDEFYYWMTEYLLQAVAQRIDDIENQNQKSHDHMNELSRLQRVKQAVDRLNTITNDGADLNKIILEEPGERTYEVKPVKAGDYIQEKVFGHADVVILSSATINSKYLDSIGVKADNSAFINVQDRREPMEKQIYHCPTVDMAIDRTHPIGVEEERLNKIVDKIDEIAQKFPEDKGIVHCYKYAIAEKLHEELHLRNPDRYKLQGRNTKDEDIEEFKQMDGNQILLGVKNHRGLDLKDEQSRFNIITKVPYPIVSKRTKTRNSSWYYLRAVNRIVQATGRTTRGKGDWSATYILDKSFTKVADYNEGMFPTWFSFEEVDSIEDTMENVEKARQEIGE